MNGLEPEPVEGVDRRIERAIEIAILIDKTDLHFDTIGRPIERIESGLPAGTVDEQIAVGVEVPGSWWQ
jgi:hypothetical protein